MTFALYPKPAARALRVPRAPSPRADTPIDQLTGPPPPEFGDEFVAMMFIRLAVLSGNAQPVLTLKADTGASILLRPQRQLVFGQPGETGLIGSAFITGQDANTCDIAIGLTDSSAHAWTLGIAHSETTADQYYTWVVADTPTQTHQLWNDPTPPHYHIAAMLPIEWGANMRVGVDDDTNIAYVTSGGDRKVRVIDDNAITDTVDTFQRPDNLAVDAGRHAVWFTQLGENKAFALDGHTVSSVQFGPPGQSGEVAADALAVHSVDRAVYVTHHGNSSLAIIDADTRSVRSTIGVGASPAHIALGHQSSAAHVANRANDSVTIIRNAALHSTVTVGKQPGALAVGPDDRFLYVCNSGEPSVSVVDLSTEKVTSLTLTDIPPLPPAEGALIPLPENPEDNRAAEIAVDPQRMVAYIHVINARRKSLFTIDTRTNILRDTGLTIYDYAHFAVDRNTHTLYVVSQQQFWGGFAGLMVIQQIGDN